MMESTRMNKTIFSVCVMLLISISNAYALGKEQQMRISIHANGNITTFALNDSRAAKELYGQLPL